MISLGAGAVMLTVEVVCWHGLYGEIYYILTLLDGHEPVSHRIRRDQDVCYS